MVKTVLSNLFGVIVTLLVFSFFFETSLNKPVMELHQKTRECLRVLDSEGKPIENGCKLAKKGELISDHRYVAR